MQRNTLSKLLVVVSFIWIAASSASAQPEPSRCITEADIQITASPSRITLGQRGTVKWTVNLPNGCAAVSFQLNGKTVRRTGTQIVTPPRSQMYTLVITHNQGHRLHRDSASAGIAVDFPDRVVINSNTPDPVQVLIGALASNPVVIELCNVDLNLTGLSLEVGDNTTLTASSACARGPRNIGSRLFVTDNRRADKPLFLIRGDNVLFSGFRLEGPSRQIFQGDDRLERAVAIFPLDLPQPIRSIEISNMEIFHWSGAGIYVRDNTASLQRGRLFNTNVGAIRIRDNYIHHNRHGAGNGYGVVVNDGAYALIERNVFDQNRHAIAGGSRDSRNDFSGYTARDNLILTGGGRHCTDTAVEICWQTHQIDMHGDQSTLLGGEWCCGTAGETIILEQNTVLYTEGDAIKIRGNPTDKAVVDGNVFKHKNRGDAIKQNGNPGPGDNITNPIDVRSNNVFNFDPLAELGTCDFVGDGKQDQFMATGVSWWARSPVTLQWRYLNRMKERLPQLVLRNIDNDGKCDVALRPATAVITPRKFSKNGIGPWVDVQGTGPISDR